MTLTFEKYFEISKNTGKIIHMNGTNSLANPHPESPVNRPNCLLCPSMARMTVADQVATFPAAYTFDRELLPSS
jgi:hypothetical protein